MLKNIRVLKMVTYNVKRTIYISEQEQEDLIDSLTPTEFKLYVLLKFSLSKNWFPTDYHYDALAKRMGLSPKTVQNTYYNLRKKGYVEIEFFKDGQKELCVKVVVGKEMVELYHLGLGFSQNQSIQLTEALKLYPLNDPTLTKEERIERVKSINEYIESQSTK